MTPKHTTVGNVVAATATFVIGLIVGAALYGGVKGLKDWQALVAASIALLAVAIAWGNTRLTITSARTLEDDKRLKEAKDVADIMFTETAHMVVRCCFDCEAPWETYWLEGAPRKSKTKFNLQKFSPDEPAIYAATAAKLSLLGREASRAMIEFHYRLSALRRDIENLVATTDDNITGEALGIIAFRFCLTLKPGLKVIEALSPLVDDADARVARTLAAFDETRSNKPPGTLKERIEQLLANAPDDWVRVDVEP